MPGLIPQRFIDDLLSRADIVDVVDGRVKLRKTGKNYSGLCPFHQEKTPSFTVNPDKQFYYCFGCGAGGNAIGFLMNFENLGFPEAVESLAKDLGLEVPREDGAPRNKATSSRHEAMYQLLADAARWYQQQLRRHPQAKRAVDYLKSRGLSGEIARDYGLGFAPAGWDNLLKELGTDDQRQQLLLDTGMLIENPDNKRNPRYDRFRERIMYPIRDARGRVLGFGGRVLGNDKPKYLNSPETAVFRKGEELYGLYEARRKRRSFERFLIVEGYMDVIALAQHGIHYAVATLGTATSTLHLRKLFKAAPELVFCFDGDNAGREAAWRALQAALPLMEDGRSARFLFLPEGEDPDTQVRRIGAAAFEASLNAATRLPDFLFDTLCARLDLGAMEDKARLGRLAVPLLDKLPAGIFRQLMHERLSQLTGMSAGDLAGLAPPPPAEQPAAPSRPAADEPPLPPDSGPPAAGTRWQPRAVAPPRLRVELTPCMRAVNLLLRRPEIIRRVELAPELNEMEAPDLDLLLKVIEIARADPDASAPELMGRIYATDYGSHLTQLLGRELLTPPEGIEAEFRDILERLVGEYRRRQERYRLLEALRRRHGGVEAGP